MPEDMPGRMPEDMPDRMPDRMPKDMSDRMPEDLPVTKRVNAMVGITRSKVIVFFTLSHPAALDRQRQETTTKQRERPTAANIHQQHLPKEESKRKARAPTKDTKEQPKKGREGERTRKSKPGKTRSKLNNSQQLSSSLTVVAKYS